MPVRTIDSAVRLLERFQSEGRVEVDKAALIYAIEEVIGADPRTTKAHMSFLLKHGWINPKPDQEGFYSIDFEKIYLWRCY